MEWLRTREARRGELPRQAEQPPPVAPAAPR